MGETLLYNRIYGSLLGGIIGDAMGAPGEGKTYRQIQEAHGWVEDFEGVGTDDTVIKHILCDAIIENDGYVGADQFAASFLRNKDKYRYWYIPVRNMFHKVESGLELPVYAGLGNMQSSSSAMAISPMGMINACNPRQAALETYDVAGLIHAGATTFCRDGACALAAAVAQAFVPGATVEAVVNAATCYLHPTSSSVESRAIRGALDLARDTREYEPFRAAFYETRLQDIISDSRETVPCALALFVLSAGEPRQAIVYAANFGRDADTLGAMVGSLAGAFRGVEALGEDWVGKVTSAISGQDELARKLADIAVRRAGRAQTAIASLMELNGAHRNG